MINKSTVVFLFAIASSHSTIQINVKTASNKIDSVITYSGVDDKKVTGQEVKLFNITDENLKLGIRVELGKVPNDVFLGDPTPYHNLYEKYKWMEVNRDIRVKTAEVFEIVNQNVTLKVHSIINNTTGRIKKKVSLKETVENNIISFWCDGGVQNDEVLYSLNVTYGNDRFQFENKWRNINPQNVTVPFGLSNIGSIFIEPGQIVNVELAAVKTILLVKVVYSARLIGSVIANYAATYGKYHFWAPSVADIMKAAKLKNEILTTEYLEFRYYDDPHLKVVDKASLVPVHVIKPPKPFRAKKVPKTTRGRRQH